MEWSRWTEIEVSGNELRIAHITVVCGPCILDVRVKVRGRTNMCRQRECTVVDFIAQLVIDRVYGWLR